MKKSALFGILIMLLIFTLTFTIAEENESIDDAAYACLESKVEGKCSSSTLSSEDKVFSLLALGECKDEVISDSKYKSDVKFTAQAILALNNIGTNTDEAEEWLLSKTRKTSDIVWLLQIKTDKATTCEINYEGLSAPISIGINADGILSGATGCLSLYTGNYWLKIDQNCYGKELSISCTEDFLTTLLYKYKGTVYVSEKTSSASAGGTTTEQVNSLCFGIDSCDYEASLWASVVLYSLDYEISSYLPYLITMMNDAKNYEYLPEAFLYLLTNEFRNELLAKQSSSTGYWETSDSEFYDTALALYPFQYEDIPQKTDAINALEGSQGNDGCWGNIRDTAFLLYSIWPRSFYVGGDNGGEVDCESAGGYCMSAMSCQELGGNILDYYCSALFICCDTEQELATCGDQGGEICASDELCSGGGTSVSASDIEYGEICCVDGICKAPSQGTECEDYDGTCRTSCYSDEEEAYYSCDSGEICCIEKTVSEKKSYTWVWILLILIFLVVMGIVFKDRLRPLLFKLKSKFGKGKPGPKRGGGPRRPGFPPVSRAPQRRVPRRILPPSQRRPVRRPSARPKGDMDDVLKKLKEMSK